MIRVAIFGVSGCGRGVLPIAKEQFSSLGMAHELVFVDDAPPSPHINGHKVLRYQEWLSLPSQVHFINIAIANGFIREKIVKRCTRDGVQFFEVRAENVVQMDDVVLEEGAVLSPFVTLTSNIRIGRHFHANLYSYVEHDCIIGNYVTFGPGAKCHGYVHIEDYAYIGAGAMIKQGKPGNPIVIGKGATVGMGAVVTKSIPPGITVVGNPARPIVKQ